MKKQRVMSLLVATTVALTPMSSLAHSGRTDASGGHKDNQNKSGLGSYHYHCGGNPAHLHTNGCPYNKSKVKSTSNKSSTSKNNNTKKVQEKLNALGYNCGKADGVMGKSTKSAIKSFQKSKGLKADGVAGKATLKALGI